MKFGSLLALSAGVSLATASYAHELPVETFFRNYQYREVSISPSGDYLAAMSPDKKRVGLAVVDLQNRKANWAFAQADADVSWFRWANNDRLLFRLAKNGYTAPGLFAVNRDGGKRVALVAPRDRRTKFLEVLPGATNEVLVTSVAYSGRDSETGFYFPNVERMNIMSGFMTREVTNPGHVLKWVLDHEGKVRVGIAAEDRSYKVLYRDNTNSNWRTIAQFGPDDDNELMPVAFENDNKTLLVGHYGEEQMKGLYTFDVDQEKIKTLAFRHAECDVQSIFSNQKCRVLGVGYETERPEVYWFDPKYRSIQSKVDNALPGTVNLLISASDDDRKLIYLASNERTPGSTYLLDSVTLKLEKLFDLAEWIHPEEMAEMKPIAYKSRDGLTIHGYLTLPKDSTGKNLPLVVNPHGGPVARDTWGYDPSVQFLANRGYAVLRMNFRGSTGYGKDFMRAGFKEWGLKQQDDITDGVRWAIGQGIANPHRICILGHNYGGYAALVGLEQTPELYRCGISISGVTDVVRKIKHVEDRELGIEKFIQAERIGDRKSEKERLESVSPLRHADDIQVPVLLAHGVLDAIVPISGSKDMASALKKRGKLYDFLLKKDEADSFMREENRIELWTKVDEFLKANLN